MDFIAHRGYSAKFPENTELAFEQALLYGAKIIELDVTLTKDAKIVVIHDATLDRTTKAKGLVADYSWHELKELDAGSWKDEKFSHVRIPLFSSVLEKFGKEIAINVEIKKESVFLDEDQTIEPKLAEVLSMFAPLKHIQVSSFEPLALHRMRRLLPKAELCYLTKEKLNPDQREEMEYLEVVAQHVCIDDVDEAEVKLAHKAGIQIRTFTIKNKSDLAKAKALQVDGVFSDF